MPQENSAMLLARTWITFNSYSQTPEASIDYLLLLGNSFSLPPTILLKVNYGEAEREIFYPPIHFPHAGDGLA